MCGKNGLIKRRSLCLESAPDAYGVQASMSASSKGNLGPRTLKVLT